MEVAKWKSAAPDWGGADSRDRWVRKIWSG